MSDLLTEYEELVHEPVGEYGDIIIPMPSPPVKVICYSCGRHIYNVKERPRMFSKITASMFESAEDYILPPEAYSRMLCPLCGHTFVGPGPHLITEE